MPLTERIWASRVREICMHGLKRAEAVGQSVPPLLDCYQWLKNPANYPPKNSLTALGEGPGCE